MPENRAFRLVEKKDTIILPEDYDTIVSSVLHNVGRTVIVQNI